MGCPRFPSPSSPFRPHLSRRAPVPLHRRRSGQVSRGRHLRTIRCTRNLPNLSTAAPEGEERRNQPLGGGVTLPPRDGIGTGTGLLAFASSNYRIYVQDGFIFRRRLRQVIMECGNALQTHHSLVNKDIT
ncbi:hypothetical protein ABZP36_010285 [Zizania latifolia]